jgi:hypothetical protein
MIVDTDPVANPSAGAAAGHLLSHCRAPLVAALMQG